MWWEEKENGKNFSNDCIFLEPRIVIVYEDGLLDDSWWVKDNGGEGNVLLNIPSRENNRVRREETMLLNLKSRVHVQAKESTCLLLCVLSSPEKVVF